MAVTSLARQWAGPGQVERLLILRQEATTKLELLLRCAAVVVDHQNLGHSLIFVDAADVAVVAVVVPVASVSVQ